MRMYRRWLMSVLVIMVLFGQAAVSGSDPGAPEQEQPVVSPSELHRFLAEGKALALDRTRRLAAVSQPVQAAAGQEDFDARYYKLELEINEVTEIIYGRVTMRADALVDGFSQPILDFFSDMAVDSVFDNGVYTTSWTHAADLVTIDLAATYDIGEEFEVTVVYHGHPTEGGLQSFSFGSHSGTPVISTLSEPYMARSWWPCKDRPDDKADSVDIIVEVRDIYFVSSNGTLRDSVHNIYTTTYWWHEQYPITTYLVSLAITNYSHFREWYTYGPADADSMPVDFYPYPEHLATAEYYWPQTVQMIEFFADTFGEYPFLEEKYGMTHFNWGGAMEHQTNTSATYGSFGFTRNLIAHELAHQWWGDYITCEDWHHIWLNEGFASYCEALYAEHVGGPADYHSLMAGMQYYSGGTIYCQNLSSVWSIFTSRVYDKGAWVLHMLRGHVGHETFFDILRAYYNDPAFAHGDANSEEFRDLCAAVSGQDLDEFFSDWIYGEYYPQYRYSWLSEPGAEGEFNIYLHLRQIQTSNPLVFDMPIDIGIQRFSGVVDTVKIYNDQRSQDFLLTIADDNPPPAIFLDPANWILDLHSEEAYTFHIVKDALAAGITHVPYEDSVLAKGGTTPYQFQLATGALPEGLVLEPASGRITGAPTESGIFTFAVEAEEAGGYMDTSEFVIEVVELGYIPGDLDQSGVVQPPDVVWMVNYVYKSLTAPPILNSADLNRDCNIDPVDVVHHVNYVYRNFGILLPGCVE